MIKFILYRFSEEVVNDSTVNILDQVINEADYVAHETSIQEKSMSILTNAYFCVSVCVKDKLFKM